MTHYQQTIARLAPDVNPRHVEAYMRLEHPTLDGLDAATFKREVEECAFVVLHAPAEAERLAQSFAL